MGVRMFIFKSTYWVISFALFGDPLALKNLIGVRSCRGVSLLFRTHLGLTNSLCAPESISALVSITVSPLICTGKYNDFCSCIAYKGDQGILGGDGIESVRPIENPTGLLE
jgi:hypothetical protein